MTPEMDGDGVDRELGGEQASLRTIQTDIYHADGNCNGKRDRDRILCLEH